MYDECLTSQQLSECYNDRDWLLTFFQVGTKFKMMYRDQIFNLIKKITTNEKFVLMLSLFSGESDDHNFISLLSCPCEKFNGFLIQWDSLCKSHGWSCLLYT